MNKKKKIIFDLDVGVDDAMALIMSFYEPEIDLKLITTTFGNVGLKQATKNTCYVTELWGKKDYPIYYGASKALNTPMQNAQEVHGKNGLGNTIIAKNVDKKPLNRRGYGALEAMRDTILKYPGEITLVSVGPVTNTAKLLMKYPEVADKLERIVMMVGSIDGKGSITPYSSFNAYCDPDAVDYVIKHNIPMTITTKELGTGAYFEQSQRERFRDAGKVGQFIYDLCDGYIDKILKPGQYAVHDTCALFTILETDLFTRENVDMVINTSWDKKRGQTKFTPNKNSHITLITSLTSKEKLFKKMEDLISRS